MFNLLEILPDLTAGRQFAEALNDEFVYTLNGKLAKLFARFGIAEKAEYETYSQLMRFGQPFVTADILQWSKPRFKLTETPTLLTLDSCVLERITSVYAENCPVCGVSAAASSNRAYYTKSTAIRLDCVCTRCVNQLNRTVDGEVIVEHEGLWRAFDGKELHPLREMSLVSGGTAFCRFHL